MNIIENIKLDIPGAIGREFLTKFMGGKLIPQMEEILEEKRGICKDALQTVAIYDKFDIKILRIDK